MYQLTSLLVLLSTLIAIEAFSPLAVIHPKSQKALALDSSFRVKSSQFSTSSNDEDKVVNEDASEEEEKTLTPISDGLQEMSKSFTSEPVQRQRLDPLVASLTRMDKDMLNTPTTKVPLLGEIPLDGSIVVLLPVALIAVVGFILSINIALNSKDAFVEKMDEINAVLSSPPVKETIVSDGCRGLCSDQDEQLNNMRDFMNSLAPKK